MAPRLSCSSLLLASAVVSLAQGTRVGVADYSDTSRTAHQFRELAPRKLPPYDHPDASFFGAYGPATETYWDPQKGHFGAESRIERFKDAYEAMYSLMHDTFFGLWTSHVKYPEIDLFRRCRSARRIYHQLRFGIKEVCNGDPVTADEMAVEWPEEVQWGAKKAEGPCDASKQTRCAYESIGFLKETLGVMHAAAASMGILGQLGQHATALLQLRQAFEAWQPASEIGHFYPQTYRYGRNPEEAPQAMYEPLVRAKAILAPYADWTTNINEHFFNDPAGKRQGMWTMLHMMTVSQPRLGLEFYRDVVAHFNPCPTCRRRFMYDMPHIFASIKSRLHKLGHIRSPEDTGEDAVLVMPLTMWVYHTEVSLRVQAGMARDTAATIRGDPPSDWDDERQALGMEHRVDWMKDKRWPSPQMCPDCWIRGGCRGFDPKTDGGKTKFHVGRFLSCWDLRKVYAFLVSTYSTGRANP